MPRRILRTHESRSSKAPSAQRTASNNASAGIVPELKSSVFINGIIQAPGGANHRHCAVAQAVDLVQAAGFVVAGHQEHVGAGFDPVGKRGIVADLHAHFAG